MLNIDHESYHNMVSLKYHKMSKLDLKIAFVQLGQKKRGISFPLNKISRLETNQ